MYRQSFLPWLTAVALGVVALAATAPASAESSDYTFDWEQIVSRADNSAYDRLIASARRLIMEASESDSDAHGKDLIMRAAEQYAAAAKLKPEDPHPHYMAAEILELFDLGKDYKSRRRQIIHHAGEFIRLAPNDPRLTEMLFTRSIEYSRNGDEDSFKKAIADYELNLRLKDYTSNDPRARSDLGTTMSNAAELYMGIGEVDKAIEMFVAALEYAIDSGAQSLYTYGLAVALDRDGQHVRAIELMKKTFATDNHGEQLHRRGVFFVPEGDKHYYQALGYESVGDIRKAKLYYELFLRDLPASRYASQARANIKGLAGKKQIVPNKPEPLTHI